MTDSILDSTKKVLGIDPSYTAFDEDVIMGINTALSILQQVGVGPDLGFEITSKAETWEQFFNKDATLNSIKSYVFLRVRLLFDSANLTSFATQAMERQLDELLWRISARREEVKYPWVPPVPPDSLLG